MVNRRLQHLAVNACLVILLGMGTAAVFIGCNEDMKGSAKASAAPIKGDIEPHIKVLDAIDIDAPDGWNDYLILEIEGHVYIQTQYNNGGGAIIHLESCPALHMHAH